MGSMEMAMLTGATTFLWPMMSFLMLTPLLVYLVARWRLYREQLPVDPQLGIKVAVAFFKLVGYQIMLVGLVLIIYRLLVGSDDDTSMLRVGFGLAVPGGLVFVGHAIALAKSNDVDHPTVGRMFAGAALVQIGLAAIIGLVFTCVTMFQKDSPGEVARFAFAMTLVYFTAWGIQAFRFVRRVMAPPAA
jgi:hypothetical protein